MNSSQTFFQELASFVRFFAGYIRHRLITFWFRFEGIKDIIVVVLVARRGKYSQSFLNTSFLLLVSASLIGGPVIAQNNPFIADYFNNAQESNASVLDTDIYSLPVETNFSIKPRDKVLEHTVTSGETLASIAKQFDVSVDSIKWATGLKTDTIKPGQVVKVPPVTGVVHKVTSGDTVYSIAKKYHTDAQQIVNFPFNDFTDLDSFGLTTGQILYVPDGTIEAAPIQRIIPGTGSQIAAGTPGTGNFIWPTTGNVTQNPVWYHMALDIANRAFPPVLVADTGTVTYAACQSVGYGCHIIVNHGNGYQTLYAHLSRIMVSVGQGVSRGSQIGVLGSTGRSTGPHLHFEIRSGGRLLNPLTLLK